MSHPVRRHSVRRPLRQRVTAASPTPEKLATFLRHLEESGSVSLAAERTGIARRSRWRPTRCATPPSPAPWAATTAC